MSSVDRIVELIDAGLMSNERQSSGEPSIVTLPSYERIRQSALSRRVRECPCPPCTFWRQR